MIVLHDEELLCFVPFFCIKMMSNQAKDAACGSHPMKSRMTSGQ